MEEKKQKIALIIGGGPAGLTAAYEFLEKTDIKPIVLEKSAFLGGISHTENYKGNRMDIGGHRFFSKSDVVMNWWLNIFPIESKQDVLHLSYQNQHRKLNFSPSKSENSDEVFIVRNRVSRIYFKRKFFSYPIQLNLNTIKNLGFGTSILIFMSYLKAVIFPIKNEKNLEDFFINRFGKRLYLTFFKSYTEKVWGKPCTEISKEWGEQRIKGLSIRKAIAHFFSKNKSKNVETSLIESFIYPKLGPGQLWEKVAQKVHGNGGEVLLNKEVVELKFDAQNQCKSLVYKDSLSGEIQEIELDFVLSSMPVKELFEAMQIPILPEIKSIATSLEYRDFITVGVLLKSETKINDNWIYIQEQDVLVGRLQIFNNWSESLVENQENTWIGMEYFCNDTDAFWGKSDEEIKTFALKELEQLNLFPKHEILDTHLIRMKKAYPSYFGSYTNFPQIIDYLEQFQNLFLIGRNGMHKYNNQDHSMLTAIESVRLIQEKQTSKGSIWSINTEESYHEEK